MYGGRSFLNTREVSTFLLLAILEDETAVGAAAYDGNGKILEFLVLSKALLPKPLENAPRVVPLVTTKQFLVLVAE